MSKNHQFSCYIGSPLCPKTSFFGPPSTPLREIRSNMSQKFRFHLLNRYKWVTWGWFHFLPGRNCQKLSKKGRFLPFFADFGQFWPFSKKSTRRHLPHCDTYTRRTTFNVMRKKTRNCRLRLECEDAWTLKQKLFLLLRLDINLTYSRVHLCKCTCRKIQKHTVRIF